MTINPPKRLISHPDYGLNCQEAIEAEFQELVARAVEAGWDEDAVGRALFDLALNHIRARNELKVTEIALRAVRRQGEH